MLMYLLRRMRLTGWIELDGKPLSLEEIKAYIHQDPSVISRFGGEFYLECGPWAARDYYGIIPGPCEPAAITYNGEVVGSVHPLCPEESLHDAICTAVRLRSDCGITALSGGVDSALVAALARRPCLVVGLDGSHDIRRANEVASLLQLPLHIRTVTSEEIAAVLPDVISHMYDPNPVDLAIGTTLYFVAQTARQLGYERILTGQGADEIFGGYDRYTKTPVNLLDELFARDFASLSRQGARDQSIARHLGAYLSMPYLDIRVVCAAQSIPPEKRVHGGIRKKPLREVASLYLPESYAYYEKKAMQYGSGIWKEIKRIARQNGYHSSVSDFISHIRRT